MIRLDRFKVIEKIGDGSIRLNRKTVSCRGRNRF